MDPDQKNLIMQETHVHNCLLFSLERCEYFEVIKFLITVNLGNQNLGLDPVNAIPQHCLQDRIGQSLEFNIFNMLCIFSLVCIVGLFH
jgi:hypothetical protein